MRTRGRVSPGRMRWYKRFALWRYRLEDLADAGDRDGALDVIGQDCQAGLGGDVLEAARSEVGGAHPSLDGAEYVLNSASPDRHGVGHCVKAALHLVEHCLMLPSSDALLLAGGAQMTR